MVLREEFGNYKWDDILTDRMRTLPELLSYIEGKECSVFATKDIPDNFNEEFLVGGFHNFVLIEDENKLEFFSMDDDGEFWRQPYVTVLTLSPNCVTYTYKNEGVFEMTVKTLTLDTLKRIVTMCKLGDSGGD